LRLGDKAGSCPFRTPAFFVFGEDQNVKTQIARREDRGKEDRGRIGDEV
jgi:hypothetical protein